MDVEGEVGQVMQEGMCSSCCSLPRAPVKLEAVEVEEADCSCFGAKF